MASTRAVPGDGGDGTSADLLGSAAALRWSRPDLTGAIADHVLEIADADADHGLWLRAAGWAVSARSATGDGRAVASEVLDGVVRRGAHVLDEPAADRLRVELAVLATGAGRLATARTLLTPVSVADTVPELRADALGALARCAVEDRPAAVDGLLRRVESVWAEVGGPRGHIGTAAASLVAATAERRAGRPDAAVAKAAEGLAHLDSARAGRSQSPSRHLAAGLAAEWISGLLDAGRTDEARDGCAPLEARLRDTSRPSRQIALLRLAVARTVTASGAEAVVAALTQAAQDAAASDAPDLESVCLSTLGALQEKAGQLEQGLESVRLGVAAQRRDQQRAERFRRALDAAVSSVAEEVPPRAATNGGRARVAGHHRSEASTPTATSPAPPTGSWTDWSSAVARDRTSTGPVSTGTPNVHPAGDAGRAPTDNGRTQPHTMPAAANGSPGGNGGRSGRNGAAGHGAPGQGNAGLAGDPTVTDPHGISPWRGWTDESPIGHLLAQSLRSGGTGAGHAETPHPAETPSRAEPPPSAEPPPPAQQGPRSGAGARRREQRRYPDAVADPWSTGSWSTGHWARKDELAGPRSAAGPDASAGDPPPAASGRTGRRRRPDALDGAAQAAPRHEPPATTPPATTPPATTPPATTPPATTPPATTPPATTPPATTRPATKRPDPAAADGPSRGYDRSAQGRAAGTPDADRSALDRAEAAADLAVEPGSGSWLQNALAELDRAWGATTTSASASDRRPEPGPESEGCVVVIDLARDGRRFAGRRAGAVVRTLADRLGDRLPSGARLRHDDADALSVVLPGWSRSPATEWMHRTLPGLFEDFVPDDDLPGTQLRAAVHDADGPVGAQLLQRLDRPRRRHATRDALSTGPLWGSLPAEPVATAAPPATGGRRHRRSAEDTSEQAAATSQDVMRDTKDVKGTASAAGRTEQADSTDGLGLADLLAGALAAYRGI